MRFAAVLALAAGCAATGAPVHVALQLQGAAAGAAEQQRCLDAATRAGAIVDARASVQALVTLEPGGGRLQVLSATRGLVHEESRPPGSVEKLCHDAALAAAAAHAPSLAADPGSAAGAPPPDHALTPTTSGGINRGPSSN
jgi:hypothetical protein